MRNTKRAFFSLAVLATARAVAAKDLNLQGMEDFVKRASPKRGRIDLPFTVGLITAGLNEPGGTYENVVATFAVKNSGSRSADLIKANIVVTDILGDPVGAFQWKNNAGIAGGETVEMTGRYATFRSKDLEKLVQVKPKLLKFDFEIFRIAWTDGQVENFEDE